MPSKNQPITTAYGQTGSQEYDAKRFTTPAGIAFHDREIDQLKEALTFVARGSRILELGCGTGRFSKFVAERGYQIYGVDPSSYMLEVAADKCSEFDATFTLAEGKTLPFPDNCFDFVFSIRVTNQTESSDYALAMIKETIRVVKSNHYVLIEFVNAYRTQITRRKTTALTFNMIEGIVNEIQSQTHIVKKTGIMLLSQTLLNRLPTGSLTHVMAVDRMLSPLLPVLCPRNYVLIRK